MSGRLSIPRLLLPVAGYAAAALFALNQADRTAGAEGSYLALLACTVLLPVAALPARPALELALGTMLSTALVWVLPAGPARGAALSLLLVAVIGSAALRGMEGAGVALRRAALLWGGLALHLLFRARSLLHPELDLPAVVDLLGLPLAAGLALAYLAEERPLLGVLAAAAAAIVLAGGWSSAATLSLLALASGDYVRRRREPGLAHWLPLAAVAAAGLLVEPALGLVLVLSGSSLAAGHRAGAQLGIVAAALTAAALLPAARGWQEVWSRMSLLLLLVPTALVAGRARALRLLAATALCLAALGLARGADAAAGPIALAALSLASDGAAARLQALWSGFLTAAAAVAASYPWLRDEPLAAALGLLGASPSWPAAVALTAVTAGLTLACELAGRRLRRPPTLPFYLGLGALGMAIALAIPAGGIRPLSPLPVTLHPERPAIEAELTGAPIGRLVADTFLANAAELPRGTPVASARLLAADGSVTEWLWRSGIETGEWAAARPEVASLPGFAAPAAWISWIAPDGGGFAQRYRAARTLAEPVAATRIVIERAAELPPEVRIAVFGLELQPARRRFKRAPRRVSGGGAGEDPAARGSAAADRAESPQSPGTASGGG